MIEDYCKFRIFPSKQFACYNLIVSHSEECSAILVEYDTASYSVMSKCLQIEANRLKNGHVVTQVKSMVEVFERFPRANYNGAYGHGTASSEWHFGNPYSNLTITPNKNKINTRLAQV